MKEAVIGIIGAILLLIAILYFSALDNQEWQEFKKAHNCKIIAQTKGTTFTTISSNGHVGIGSTPNTTSFLCDDNITYTR